MVNAYWYQLEEIAEEDIFATFLTVLLANAKVLFTVGAVETKTILRLDLKHYIFLFFVFSKKVFSHKLLMPIFQLIVSTAVSFSILSTNYFLILFINFRGDSFDLLRFNI